MLMTRLACSLALLLVPTSAWAQSTSIPPPKPRAGAEDTVVLSADSEFIVTPLRDYTTRIVHGFTVKIAPDLAAGDVLRARRVLAALEHDLYEISLRIPPAALNCLHNIPVVVSASTPAVPGMTGRGMVFHPSAQWLTGSGLDAEREGTIEVCNADDFLLWRAEQPFMVLHEFAHGFHWQLGMDRQDVRAAFLNASETGLYRLVGYVLDDHHKKREAYALRNAGEYFSELTEAYFGRNDYFPYVRSELEAYDPQGYALIERLWNLSAEDLAVQQAEAKSKSTLP